jgi:peroxiredoxin
MIVEVSVRVDPQRVGPVLVAVVAAALLAATVVASPQAQAPTDVPDVATLGPQVGTTLPAFRLSDQYGRPQTIDSLMGPEGLMLVFSRSADWCPYCKTQLVEIQGRLEDIHRNGLAVAVITYDPVPVLAEFAERRSITFPMLSDQGSAVIRQYGILNTTVPAANPLFGYPFPGTFVVNRAGVVTSRFFEPTYQERSTVASVLVRLGNRVDVPATRLSSTQIDLTAYLTDQSAAPGTHFSVVIDGTPGPRIHVYAPGVVGYRPIALRLAPQPGLVIRDAHYPPSETYLFEPLDERVPVYQQPFRIVQDLMVDPTAEGQRALAGRTSIDITGTLDYQACDDRICYTPQTVSLTWTVALIPLDRERASQRE